MDVDDGEIEAKETRPENVIVERQTDRDKDRSSVTFTDFGHRGPAHLNLPLGKYGS